MLGQPLADIIDYLPRRDLMMRPPARNRVVPNARVVRASDLTTPFRRLNASGNIATERDPSAACTSVRRGSTN